jgi:hypothetical protein
MTDISSALTDIFLSIFAPARIPPHADVRNFYGRRVNAG